MSSKSTSPASAQASVPSIPSFNQQLIPAGIKPLRAHLAGEGEDAAIRWLAQSIKTHTQLVPIVADGKTIIDGVRRMRACEIAGTKPWIVQLKDITKGGTVDAWNALNFEGRRHLSLNERALLGVELSQGQQVGSNQHTKPAAAAGGMTQGEASKVVGVSTDLIQKAKKAVEMADAQGRKEEVMTHMRAGASIPQVIRELELKEVKQKVDKIARKNGEAALSLDNMIKRGVKLSFVLADPPWNYGKEEMMTSNGAPHTIYPTMSTADIKAMPIADLAAKDAVLWLWVPNCLLEDGLKVMAAWGFHFVTTAIWAKNKAPPTPGSVKPYHETLLIGKRGAGLAHDGTPMRSVLIAPMVAHSKKPAEFAMEAERLYPDAAKIELFCRTPRKGWVAHGNQSQAKGAARTAATKPAKSATKKKAVVKPVARVKAKVAARKR